MLKKAMILAAGFGTRLKPLTDKTPKALLPYKCSPMIHNVITRLIASGISEIIINTHYLSGQLEDYFKSNSFDAKITLVHEDEILGTGGGIKNACRHLNDVKDFLIYNVDVDSDINLEEMYQFHLSNSAFVTLAVKQRATQRPLLIDESNNLIGRVVDSGESIYGKANGSVSHTAFCGVHIISSEIFDYFPPENNFDIMPVYMNLVEAGKKIVCFDIKDSSWKDLGKHESYL